MCASRICFRLLGPVVAAGALLFAISAQAQTSSFAPASSYPDSMFRQLLPQQMAPQQITPQVDPDEEAVEPESNPQSNDAPLAPNLRRQIVAYPSREAPGTIVIDTAHTYLYFTLGGGRAIRYGVGVGREGFTWSGVTTIERKSEWPDWIPPSEMIDRQPYLPRWMAGGPGNPLGARAMNLGGTVYRIHGTNAPETIGQAVSSGCFRLVNDDVIDLYSRVPLGTKVMVQHQ